MRTNATTTVLKLHFVMDFKKLKIYRFFTSIFECGKNSRAANESESRQVGD